MSFSEIPAFFAALRMTLQNKLWLKHIVFAGPRMTLQKVGVENLVFWRSDDRPEVWGCQLLDLEA
jgi:hypothetical protein